MEPGQSFRQVELSRLTQLDDGFTSRIVRRLEQQGLLERAGDGRVRVSNPDLLLDAWSEIYDFQQHSVLRGHVSARSGEELLRRTSAALAVAGSPRMA